MALITDPISLTDVDVCQGERCPDHCDPQGDCVVVAVSTLEAAGSPHMYYNLSGGDLDQWVDVSLTEWTTAGADAVLCLGEFVIIVSAGETAILRSDDRGTTRVEVDETVVTDWASNAPAQIDGLDQTFVVICGANGYVWGTYDAGRAWETLEAGEATTENLARIMIARDNPMVIWAIGANNAVIKSENGGQNWYAITGPSATDGLLGLWVVNQNAVIIVNDDGEVWETEDGGTTWTQQLAPPDIAATLTAADIAGCGCGVLYMVATDGSASWEVYRNVDGGASGRWFVPTGDALSVDGVAVACCDHNRAIVVGGDGTTTAMVALLT